MAGSSLDRFVDFSLATRAKLASSPDELVSQASKYRTHLWPLMLKSLSKDLIVQGGSEIVDFLQLAYSSSYSHYNAADDFTFTGTDSLTQIKVPWRFTKVHSVTWEHEIDLQQGGEEVVFKRVKKAKMSELELSFHEGMEESLWATPDNATMEAAAMSGTGAPQSLRCLLPDDGAAVPAGFTTVQTVNPTTFPNWKPQKRTFNNTSDATRRADEGGVLQALDELWLLCQYKSPTSSEEYVKNTSLQKMSILSNIPSYRLLVSLATTKNNVLNPKHDIGWANGQVVYHGLPTRRIEKLDNIDTDVANNPGEIATAQDGVGKKGFKYRFLNFNSIRPVFHGKHYRRMQKFEGGASQPHARVVLEDTWWNLMFFNRREQGIAVAA